MLLCGEVDKGAGRVVWLWSWVVFPVVWPTVDGLAPVLWAGGVTVGGGGLGPVLGLIVASVTGAAVCDLLGVEWDFVYVGWDTCGVIGSCFVEENEVDNC